MTADPTIERLNEVLPATLYAKADTTLLAHSRYMIVGSAEALIEFCERQAKR